MIDEMEWVKQAKNIIESHGRCSHGTWVQVDIQFRGNRHPLNKPVVGLANDEDGHYVQYFHNQDELEAFIGELREVGAEAWGRNGE